MTTIRGGSIQGWSPAVTPDRSSIAAINAARGFAASSRDISGENWQRDADGTPDYPRSAGAFPPLPLTGILGVSPGGTVPAGTL